MVQNNQSKELEEIKIYCHAMEQSELKKFDKSEKYLAIGLSNTSKGKKISIHHQSLGSYFQELVIKFSQHIIDSKFLFDHDIYF